MSTDTRNHSKVLSDFPRSTCDGNLRQLGILQEVAVDAKPSEMVIRETFERSLGAASHRGPIGRFRGRHEQRRLLPVVQNMMPRLPACFLAFAVVHSSACDPSGVLGPGPNSGGAPVEMSASRYILTTTEVGWRGELGFTFHNVTDRTISLLNCRGGFGLRLEKWDDGRWIPAWHPVLLGCLSPPIEIGPEESHEHTLHLFSGRPGSNHYPQFSVDPIDGIYRLVILEAFWDYDHDGPPWGEPPPLEARVSDRFEISTEG
jgi:hypothetical protein